MSDFLTTIGEVAQVYDGPHATPKKISKGPYFLSISSLEKGALDLSKSAHISEEQFIKWTKRVTPEEGDVLFSYETRLGDAAVMPSGITACLGRRMGLLRPDRDKVLPVYLLYAYLSPAFQEAIRAHTIHGATVDRIALKELPEYPIRIPSLQEQEQVVLILKSLDNKIQLNNQTNQTLEAIAQAIFKSWFVDFDPVKAKIAVLESGGSAEEAELAAMSVISSLSLEALAELKQSNPDRDAHDYMDAGGRAAQGAAAEGDANVAGGRMPGATYQQLAQTAALFPSRMQESELGEIPEGWALSEIGKEVTVVGGGTPSTKSSEFWDDGDIHWTTPKDMSNLNSKVLLQTNRKITAAGLKKISSGLLPINTVLMSSRAPVGYLALAKVPVAINQGYIAMKCENILSPEFVMLWCEQNMDEIKQRASGTTFAEISKNNFKPIPIVVPIKYLVDVFTDKISDIYTLIANNSSQSESLAEIRDALLPRLLNGDFFEQDSREAQ